MRWRGGLVVGILVAPALVSLLGLAPGPAAGATGRSQASAPAAGTALPPGCAATPSATTVTSAPGVGGSAQVLLAGQTSWVRPGGRLVLDLATTGGRTTGLDVYIEVFNQLSSRSDFAETLCNQIPTPLVQTFGPVPVSSLPPDPSQPGAVQFPITVEVPGLAGAKTVTAGNAGPSTAPDDAGPTGSSPPGNVLVLGNCATACPGVYPVQVLLEPAGGTGVLSQLTTHLVLTDPAAGTKRLALAWTLDLSAPPILTSTGKPVLAPDSTAPIEALAEALGAYAQVPLTLAPSPVTLAAMAASASPPVRRSLGDLAAWAAQPSHQVVAGTFAPVAAASLVGAGLSSQLSAQLGAGAAVLGATLHVRPGTATWISGGTLDQAALRKLAALPAQPVRRIVLSPADLAPLPEPSTPQITLTQPFALATPAPSGNQVQSPAGKGGGATQGTAAHIEAVTADPGLAAHLVDGPGAVLAAHQLLADLAMIYFDAPNATYGRGVVLDTPTSWRPDATFLRVALSALADSPIVQPVTLDQLFAQTPQSVIEPYGGVLVRQLSSASPPAPSLPGAAIVAHRAYLKGFESTLGPNRPAVLTSMEDLLLSAESTALAARARTEDLHSLSALIHHQFSTITLPTDTVTLTAPTARLPITLTSDLAYPVTAILQVSSDKLGFLGRGPSQRITLSQHDKTVEFEVHARATGRFPVQVTLLSPYGGIVLASSRFAVRSSAFSPVAIALTVAAGLVLASWWGQTLLRGRRTRNRRLVPAGEARS